MFDRYTTVMPMTARTMMRMDPAASGQDCGALSKNAPKVKDITIATPHQMPVAMATLFRARIAVKEQRSDRTKNTPLSRPNGVKLCAHELSFFLAAPSTHAVRWSELLTVIFWPATSHRAALRTRDHFTREVAAAANLRRACNRNSHSHPTKRKQVWENAPEL